jgi:chromosome segregation ATPase
MGRNRMRNQVIVIALFFSLFRVAGVAQTQSTDSQTLRGILVEIRAMREDMRVMQSTQMLIAELELQQGVVSRATEAADTARNRLNQIRENQKLLATQIELLQDRLENAVIQQDRNTNEQTIENDKSRLTALETSEKDANSTLQDMQQRLQNAQDKLESIESELNSTLARMGPVAKDPGQP